MGFSGFTYEN